MLGPDKLQPFPPDEWSDFESMVTDLVEAELGNGRVQKHGRRGQNQFGVDLTGRRTDGRIVGVQCKKKDVVAGHVVTSKELRKETTKAKSFRPKLAEFVVTTTAPDDGSLQREALRLTNLHARQGLFSVRVEGWNSIKRRFSEHPHVYHKYYGHPPNPTSFVLESAPPQPIKARSNPKDTDVKRSPLVLSHRLSHAFGLLATSTIPLTQSGLIRLLPSIN